MNRILTICYQKIQDMLTTYDEFAALAQDRPKEFQRYLFHFTMECNIAKRKNKNSSSPYISKDTCTALIKQYGLYGAIANIQKLDSLIPSSNYLSIALGVISIELQEVLDTSLKLKLLKLFELSQKQDYSSFINLINNEDKINYLLGLDSIGNPVDQISFFSVESPPKRLSRYDIYLQAYRKLNIDSFLIDFIKTNGKEKFNYLMGEIICFITDNEEAYNNIPPYISQRLINIAESLLSVEPPLHSHQINPGQLTLKLPE